MHEQKHAKPVYTRTGDDGTTGLIGTERVFKFDARIDAVGALDELNSVIGVLRESIADEFQLREAGLNDASDKSTKAAQVLDQQLESIQHQLFTFGSHLAVSDESLRHHLPKVKPLALELEKWMDEHSIYLTELKNFILPGGGKSASFAHFARAIARRAERAALRASYRSDSSDSKTTPENPSSPTQSEIVQNLNRLGDYFFVIARRLSQIANRAELIWAAK